MMGKIKVKGVEAALFDFEGTLVGHEWNRPGAVQETLNRLNALGLPLTRLEGKKYSLLKNEAIAIASEVGRSPDQVRQEIDRIYDRFDEDALSRWSLRPEAKELLSSLKGLNIRAGLVTNLGGKVVEQAMKKLDLSSLFHVMVSRNDVRYIKPHGEGIRLALHRLGIPREKALFVGDSLDDIQAAKEAEVRVIIILGGENSQSDLLSGSPDLLIQNYGELIALLKEDRN